MARLKGSRKPASEESWAWANLDPEIRIPLVSQVHRELAKRSISGALVYFVICVALALATPYYRDHPAILVSGTSCTFVLGVLRIAAAQRLKALDPTASSLAKPLFIWVTYATFALWGVFCAWTLHLYGEQWTAMFLLLSTAALAGGATSSLAPNLHMAFRCLVVLIGPTIIAAFTLSDRRNWALGGLGGLYLAFLMGQAKDNWRAFWSASVAAEMEKIRGSADRRKAEQEKASLVTAIEQAAEEILITDAEGNIQYCNPSFERLTGYSRSEVLGRNPRFLKSGKHDPEFYRNLWTTIKSGGVWTGRITNKKKDGTLYETEGTISPIYDAASQLTGFVSARYDVTALLELESQLRQAQKMESVGRLAGGVAHDFNNLLTVIAGYRDLLLRSLLSDDPRRGYVEQIGKAADSAASLTQQLLAFSRKQMIRPRAIDLNALITQIRELIQRLVGEDVELLTVLDPALDRVLLDPEQTTHIFMNLAANARDAMPGGGTLTIRTARVPKGKTPAISGMSGPTVQVSVMDTGTGMDEEARQHVFEPFFTTKQRGWGTGLGLSTVYGIVQQNGGWIEVQSEAGQGTAFHIYFPCLRSPAPADESQRSAPAPRGGSETIMVVEDLQEVRALITHILESHGFRILSAASGGEALARAQEYADPIDLLLTDVVMPGMNGRQLADQLMTLRPQIKVLFTTGYSWEVIANRGILDLQLPYLPKPFTPDELVSKVRQVLGPPSR
jgi:PAS domain S-box-containing protein